MRIKSTQLKLNLKMFHLNTRTYSKRDSENDTKELADVCDICDYVPSKPSKKTIRVHKNSVHFGVKFNCSQCQNVYTTRSNMLKHVATTHYGRKEYCSQCSYSTNAKENIKKHNQNKHSKQIFKCPFESCDFVSPTTKNVELHKQFKHEEEKFCCRMCSEKFHIIQQLKTHIKGKHGGQFCDLCLLQPSSMDALWEHTQQLHNGVVYICQQCGLKCPSKLNMKTHVKTAHSAFKRKQIINTSNYICDVCNYRPKKISKYAVKIKRSCSPRS